MLTNYLKIAARDIKNHYLYSAINILGLGIGLACCLLILLFVRFETSFEEGFSNSERIYRISREYLPIDGARRRIPASNNAPVAPALVDDFPEIEAVGRIWGGGLLVRNGETAFEEGGLRFADQAIVDIFDFEWIAADADQTLQAPASIVLSESLARKYFGRTDVVGESLEVMDMFTARVTGVIRDLPDNTHLELSGLVSLNTITNAFGQQFLQNWNSNTDFHTYFLLGEGADVAQIENRIPAFIDRHIGENASSASTMRVMNIRDIHLHSDRDEEWQPPGSIAIVYSFTAIAFSILLIACINFMSIATARSGKRAREVGMRKAVGATRRQLLTQFLGESFGTACLAMLVAVALMEVVLPAFSNFVGTDMDISLLTDGRLLFMLLCLLVGVGIVSGAYPAVFLSAYQPSSVLKGELTQGNRGLAFRNVLVVLQFAIAITLLISTAVIEAQRNFVDRFDLGFNKDQIVVLRSASTQGYQDDWPILKQELLTNSAIEGVTASHFLPFGFNDNQIPVRVRGTATESRIQYMMVDYDFFSTYGIELASGRTFSDEMGTDAIDYVDEDNPEATTTFIFNNSAAAALGLTPDEAVDRLLEIPGADINGPIIGVTENTYFESVHLGERPIVFVLSPPQVPQNFQRLSDASIRIRADAIPQALAHIDATWQTLYPDQPLNRRFLDDDFQAMYEAERKQGQLLGYFSIIAVAIACFGLFGLATFNAERRTKEIGVRKVMGGSVWSIVLLLTNDFSKLVLISNVIAWPVAYLAMNRWLENFVYRIDLTPLVFIGSGLIALCIAWVTVGGTAARAASARPVLALRYE